MSNRMIKTRILLLATALLICESCSQKKGKVDLVEQNASSSVDAQQNDGPADTILIKSHLTALTKTKSFRTHSDVAQLDQTAEYIRSNLARYTPAIVVQEYSAAGQHYKNIVASFGVNNSRRIIIGAHYDVYG